MQNDDDPRHWGEPEFEQFVAQELDGLAQRATAADVCFGCLSDRLLYEIVVSLVRTGVPDTDVMDIVQQALAEADETDDFEDVSDPSKRVH